jgi:hypothetical protein
LNVPLSERMIMHTIFSSESSSCDESTLATPYRKEIKTIAVNMGKRRAAKPKGKEPGTQKRQRVQTFLVSVMRCWVLQFDDGVCPFYSCSPSKLRARAHTHTHTHSLSPPHPPYSHTHTHTLTHIRAPTSTHLTLTPTHPTPTITGVGTEEHWSVCMPAVRIFLLSWRR